MTNLKALVLGTTLAAGGCGPMTTPLAPHEYCEITYVINSGPVQHYDTETSPCFVVETPGDLTVIQVGPAALYVPPYGTQAFEGVAYARASTEGKVPIKGSWQQDFPAFEINFGGYVSGFVRGYLEAEHINHGQ